MRRAATLIQQIYGQKPNFTFNHLCSGCSRVMSVQATAAPPGCTFLNQPQAAALDEELMRTFSTDQLMELAGLSVAQAMHEHYRGTASGAPSAARCFGHGTDIERVVVVCGPGNNGGDGLVVARHLAQFRFATDIVVVYPKLATVSKPLYLSLLAQLAMCHIPVQAELPDDLVHTAAAMRSKGPQPKPTAERRDDGFDENDGDVPVNVRHTLVVDAVFGYSFSGDVREPYRAILDTLNDARCRCVSVDVPSGWHVETGLDGLPEGACALRTPEVLVSLMLPKQGVAALMQQRGTAATTAHYLGGRFVPAAFQEAHNLTIPMFPGHQQFVLL